MSTVLSLTGVTKTYPGVVALNDVSVAVESGRVHAILGENGAGKSTLVGIAAGSIVPDWGTIDLGGEQFTHIQTREARERGLAIVYQVPALAPSLTVLDAVMLLLPDSKRPARRDAMAWLTEHFESLGLVIDPKDIVSSLSLREAHLVEIAAALASDPSVLVLDEPTEALGPEETAWLFMRVGELVARGAAIVYITHRIPEVVEIANDLTVLRDGRVVGGGLVQDFTGDEIVELIIGRSLETTFPAKPDVAAAPAETLLDVANLSGAGFSDVSMHVEASRIVGLAGVEGNGQREFLRALSGGNAAKSGAIRIHGTEVSLRSQRAAKRAGVEYLPGDRLGEAMFGKMSVRENVMASWMNLAMPRGWADRSREYRLTQDAVAGLAIKTPTLEAPVASLSGGSQQKVLLARARVGSLRVLLVEDPTQGVDAGARVEIYGFLRSLADAGVAVVVLSTDAVELEGLCDTVLVFSRGSVRATLSGDEVTERSITGTAVLSSGHAPEVVKAESGKRRGLLAVGGEFQAVILLLLAVALAFVTSLNSPAFLSQLNLTQMLAAAATIILVGLAQLFVVITGGIDLSVGSVVALSGVVVSFFGQQGVGYFILGVVLAIGAGLVVGLVNGVLFTRLSIPPVIATLVTGIAVVGLAQLLRPTPTGSATPDIMKALTFSVGGVPVVLVVAVLIAVLLWFVIMRTGFGRGLRATGSDSVKAVRMGVNVRTTRLIAAIVASGLAALGGLVLYSKTGIGDANTGQSFTLTSVTVIVIAGVSIFGGSGSAIAVAAAGLLLGTITASLSFLSLNRSWEYWLQGIFVLIAAVLPMVFRRSRNESGGS